MVAIENSVVFLQKYENNIAVEAGRSISRYKPKKKKLKAASKRYL